MPKRVRSARVGRSGDARSRCFATRWSAISPTPSLSPRAARPAWRASSRGASTSARTAARSGWGARRWMTGLRLYRAGGYEALVPQPRKVSPRTPARVLELAIALKRENPDRTAAQVHAILTAAGETGVPSGADAADAPLARRPEPPGRRAHAEQGLRTL